MPCPSPLRAKRRFGICQGQRSSEALMGRPFRVAGRWRLQPTLTAAATRIMCFTKPAPIKQRYGISITTFSLAVRTAQLCQPAGVWLRREGSLTRHSHGDSNVTGGDVAAVGNGEWGQSSLLTQ